MMVFGRAIWRGGRCRLIASSGILFVGVMFAPAMTAADPLVVVEAYNTDSYAIGGIVDSGQTISLGKDEEIGLVSQAGQKITVTGPYRGAIGDKMAGGDPSGPGSREGGIVAVLSKALTRDSKQAETLALGALRFAKLEPEDMWVIDLSQGGPHCLPANRMPVLWYAGGSRDRLVWLSRRGGKARSEIVWDADSVTAAWPAGVKVESGVAYTAGSEGGRGRTFTLHYVPADLPTKAHRAAWMAGQGCRTQAMRLLIDSEPDHRLGARAQ